MATDDERVYFRIDPDNLTDDAIDDYSEQLWRALVAQVEGDSCRLHSASGTSTLSRAWRTPAPGREKSDGSSGGGAMVTSLAGTEVTVPFVPGQEFEGVKSEWLLGRLRLDPAASPVDALEGIHVVLDDELLEYDDLPEAIFGEGPSSGFLASFSNGDIISGSINLAGEWLEHFAIEVEHTFTHVGNGADPRGLVFERLPEICARWTPTEHETFLIESPYLSADDASDRLWVLDLAGEAGHVNLNDVPLR